MSTLYTIDRCDLAAVAGGKNRFEELHDAGMKEADYHWNRNEAHASAADPGSKVLHQVLKYPGYGFNYLDGVRNQRLQQLGRSWWGDGLF